jgi:hypothetical protein
MTESWKHSSADPIEQVRLSALPVFTMPPSWLPSVYRRLNPETKEIRLLSTREDGSLIHLNLLFHTHLTYLISNLVNLPRQQLNQRQIAVPHRDVQLADQLLGLLFRQRLLRKQSGSVSPQPHGL